MKHRILVTGAAGFMGSFLSEKLVKEKNFVLGIDNFFRGQQANLENLSPPNFIFINLDLSLDINIARLKEHLKTYEIDTVFHLAAVNGTQYFYDTPYFVLDQNVKITQILLKAMEETAVRYLIYTSSSEVYGNPLTLPTHENAPILLHSEYDRDSYGASKALGEFYVYQWGQKYKLKTLILRVFNLYGERMINTRYGQVIPEFIQKIIDKGPFQMIGEGQQTRCFCYITDAINMMIALQKIEATGVLNLGRDEEIKIIDLAKHLHQLMNRPFAPHFLPPRPNDHPQRRPSLEQLKTKIGPLVYTNFETGLLKTIDFYKKINRKYNL